MTINIIDTGNYAFHLAIGAVDAGVIENQQALEAYIQLNGLHLLSGAFLNKAGVEKAQYLFCGDSKPYWRYEGLKELGVIYKGKRGSGNSRYSHHIPLIMTCLEKFLAKQGVYVYFKEGYEADDIAATFTSSKCEIFHKTTVNLITSDHDWIPLMSQHPNINWVSTKQVTERIITPKTCMSFFKKHKTYNETKAKKTFPKTQITDIWKFKARFGDSTDNIPADNTGSMKYLPFIDLLNPLPEYDLKLQSVVVSDIQGYLSKPFPQRTHEQFCKNKLPFDLALTKIEW